jgi:hypothetical protein
MDEEEFEKSFNKDGSIQKSAGGKKNKRQRVFDVVKDKYQAKMNQKHKKAITKGGKGGKGGKSSGKGNRPGKTSRRKTSHKRR